MLEELVAQPHCTHVLLKFAVKYVYTILMIMIQIIQLFQTISDWFFIGKTGFICLQYFCFDVGPSICCIPLGFVCAHINVFLQRGGGGIRQF